MGKLTERQKDVLEFLYKDDRWGNELRLHFSMSTVQNLISRGFVGTDDTDAYGLTKFGVNVVKMMRGELGRGRKPRRRR